MNEAQMKKVQDFIAPTNTWLRLIKNVLLVALIIVYFGACGHMCFLFQAKRITRDEFFRYTSYATLGGA